MLKEPFSLFIVHAEGWRWTLVGQDGVTAAGGQAADLDSALEDARANAAAFRAPATNIMARGAHERR